VAAACSGGCVKCEYVRLPTSGIDSAWGCREADTLYTPCALPPFPPPPVPPSVVNVSSAPTSSPRTPPSTPGQPISPPSAIGSRSRLRPGQVGGITVALLLCLAGCVGCGIWYRIRRDPNRDVCVFPTCICRFIALHAFRYELNREQARWERDARRAEAAREAADMKAPPSTAPASPESRDTTPGSMRWPAPAPCSPGSVRSSLSGPRSPGQGHPQRPLEPERDGLSPDAMRIGVVRSSQGHVVVETSDGMTRFRRV